jgi:hypothetical protein
MLMNPRRYHYVGPAEIRQNARREAHCLHMTCEHDLVAWTAGFLPKGKTRGDVTATFIIDPAGQLWVADRRSEHVACADGGDVLAAGEITFERNGDGVEVVEVTNQSTGYCPEPKCWEVVAKVLDQAGLRRPPTFTVAFEFRRCDQCGEANLIKEDVYECAVCGAPLSLAWNFGDDVGEGAGSR